MKRVIVYSILTIFGYSSIHAQKISLNDLTNLCSKKNWEDVNQTLIAKNWTYYESEKGSTNKYNIITWSFNKDYYSDKAQGWFYLYTYEGYPNKISYSVFNKESYSLIQSSISSAGFKLVNSEIEDNEIISTYSNSNFTLTISTEKREESNYSWENNSITAYRITIIKKAGIYDQDNGKKTDYYDDNTVKAEYTLLNGKLNGQVKTYHNNGNLELTGNYTNGEKNGLFKEYDNSGNLETEYSLLNGELNGALKTYYSNSKLKRSGNYLNGKEHGNFIEFDEYGTKLAEYVVANGMKNGLHIEYYYNNETGKLQFKYMGEYINDEKSGTWNLIFIEDDNTERILEYENYIKDIKNGPFQDFKGDSLIIGSYENNNLHGEYKIYRDIVSSIIGGFISTDFSKLILTTNGSYFEGLKSGYWKNYDLTGTMINEGEFLDGLETGEWKYYYPNWTDGQGNSKPYSKQLFLIENYSNGKLNGKSIRYSYLNEEEYPCSETDENKYILDTCKRYIYQKVFETSFYKNGRLNGTFEVRDSINEVYVKGSFKDGLKDGEWFHRYIDKDYDDKYHFIYQKGNYTKDKREGKWIKYYTEGEIAETFSYKNGELHGEYVEWNQFNLPREKKQFKNGKLTELITYDSLGVHPQNKYEIYDEKYNSYKCRRTEYFDSGYRIQEYWLNKDKEIDHHWFELTFLIAINKELSDGATGYKDGEFKLYDLTNKPIVIGKYYKEDRVSLWTFFYYEQNVKIEINYSQYPRNNEKYFSLNGGLFSGEFIYIDKENGIKEERKIKNGLRNGKTFYLDIKTKKTIKKESYKNGELK